MAIKILITGTAGFIGFHLIRKLAQYDYDIVGLDNINDYYDVNLKYARLSESGISKDKIVDAEKRNFNSGNKLKFVKSGIYKNYRFIKIDLLNSGMLLKLFDEENFDYVIHLAAQAGVRYSITNPQSYINSNIIGFFNILETCSKFKPKHFIYASSSSVYGENKDIPYSVSHNTDKPVSLYAATKKSNEVMAHYYSSVFKMHVTGLRFFSVYGPWGRPDMAYYSFTKNILGNIPIKVFNHGNLERDFTYIDDVVDCIDNYFKTLRLRNEGNKSLYSVYNIGNHRPVNLLYFIKTLENIIGKKAKRKFISHQKGDVHSTFADIKELKKLIGFKPQTTLTAGLINFFLWYKKYHQ